jgi:hypothetical protein
MKRHGGEIYFFVRGVCVRRRRDQGRCREAIPIRRRMIVTDLAGVGRVGVGDGDVATAGHWLDFNRGLFSALRIQQTQVNLALLWCQIAKSCSPIDIPESENGVGIAR